VQKTNRGRAISYIDLSVRISFVGLGPYSQNAISILNTKEFAASMLPPSFRLDFPKFNFSLKPAHGVTSQTSSPNLAVTTPSASMHIGKSGAGGQVPGKKLASPGEALADSIFKPANNL
jgi:hypothetical protein